MKLLLDQGLPRSTGFLLLKNGIEALHVAEIGLASASDANILQAALLEHRVLVTLDSVGNEPLVTRGRGPLAALRGENQGHAVRRCGTSRRGGNASGPRCDRQACLP